jgi:hypothetical protein
LVVDKSVPAKLLSIPAPFESQAKPLWFSDYLSRRIRSTITTTVPREIGMNITDLVHIVVVDALRLV